MPIRRLADLLRRPPRRQTPDPPAARMVADQLRARGIRDERVLGAMSALDRRLFVTREFRDHAFEDRPLSIGYGQTISQPFIVGVMTEHLDLRPHHRVLEVGTGSAYQAAVLSRLCREVVTLERIPELARSARERLRSVGAGNVLVVQTDGSSGYSARAPYDRILVTAAAREIRRELLEQLADGGAMVAPVGETLGGPESTQTLAKWTRTGDAFDRQDIMPVRFVPLVEGAE